ncbi:zinc-binding dehydrogenase [Variovorax ureilyticus]|uniref:Zinc-binding dehydrogenase n=1 Tax=Variovorax ureilyticus TaxID=1836198 RepID=A0ABU8VMP0_9BURK
MQDQIPDATSLQLRSVITPDGKVVLSLVKEPVPALRPEEVLVRVEATPINPSDIGLMLGAADLSRAWIADGAGGPELVAPVPAESLKAMESRRAASTPVGLEGAGTVVAAGSSHAAQSLMGRTVAAMAGGMYARYRCIPAAECLVLPEGTTAAQAASCFVNPLTALGMIETARSEGHTAIVQTAAASNLGQILLRLCLADDIPLVNVVRSEQQAELLREQGARFVCNSSSDDFREQLTDAIAATGATLVLDPIGGGSGGQILSCMEAAINRRPGQAVSRYGSDVLKQLYVYGALDPRPIEIPRDVGMAWAAGGWLLLRYLKVTPQQTLERLKARVAAEITTTFASRYARCVSLAEFISPEVLNICARPATGRKFLIEPWKDC